MYTYYEINIIMNVTTTIYDIEKFMDNSPSSCPILTVSGRTCGNKLKKYGVCGKHMKYCYDGREHPLYQQFVSEYTEATLKSCQCAETAERNGVDILNVQSYYDNNLSGPLVMTPPGILGEFNNLMGDHKRIILKYQPLIDPYLVWTVAAVLRNKLSRYFDIS